jgi:hypothetical protein
VALYTGGPMSNIWQGLVGDNLAVIGDVIEVASITEFRVLQVGRCRLTNEWLYEIENVKSKKVTKQVQEINLSKINGVLL